MSADPNRVGLFQVLSVTLVGLGAGCSDPGPGPGAALAVEPPIVAFGEVVVGLLSRVKLTVSNHSPTSVTFLDVRVSEGLRPEVRLDQVPVSLPSGATAQVDAVFSPEVAGTRRGQIEWLTGDPKVDLSMEVSGSAVAPSVTVAPVSIDFGRTVVNEAATATVTVTNEGTRPVSIQGITLDQDTSEEFEVGPYYQVTLQPGENFRFWIRFLPQAPGTASGRVVVADNGRRAEPLAILLHGEGVDGALEVEPPALDFSGVLVGEIRERFFDIRNPGTSTLSVESLIITPPDAPFVLVGTEGPWMLGPGQEVRQRVRFVPEAEGFASASVEVNSEAFPDGFRVDLFGTATSASLPTVALYPLSLDFGRAEVGRQVPRPVHLATSGGFPARIRRISISPKSAPFVTLGAPNPGHFLDGWDVVAFEVVFRPVDAGSSSAQLLVELDTLDQRTLTATLTGFGSLGPTASVGVRPGRLTFGRVPRNYPAVRVLELTNYGSVMATIQDVQSSTGERLTIQPPIPAIPSLRPGESAGYPIVYEDQAGFPMTHTGTLAVSVLEPAPRTIIVPFSATTVGPLHERDVSFTGRLQWSASDANLDLHVIREGGRLFDAPDDVCWCNPNPQWGANPRARPYFQRDERQGLQPEVVRLPSAITEDVRLEVHYRGPVDGPPTVAQVEVETPVLQVNRSRSLLPGQRWQVGVVTAAFTLFSDLELPLDRPLASECF